MTLTINIILLIIAFLAMEGIAWFSHKYLMHGFLWFLHKDHHKKNPGQGFFERNDFFFLIFAIPGILLIFFGYKNALTDSRFWIGLGIAIYGFAYFFVHDIFIHQRFNLFKNVKHPYLRALRKAHKAHHKHLGKEFGECFGMLFVPKKFIIEARKK